MKTPKLSCVWKAVAIAFLLDSLIMSATANLSNSKVLPSMGVIDYESEFVRVHLGDFYKNGGIVRFFGVNYEGLIRPDLWGSSVIVPSEDEFRKMHDYGFNLIRLNINWKFLEPVPRTYDNTYIGHIDQIVDWCMKNGIYVYLNIHFFQQDYVAPSWISAANSYSDMVNDSTIQSLVDVWGMLADRYKNERYVLGYDLPINEVEFVTFQKSFSEEPDIVNLWHDWLKKKFASDLSILNSTWNWSSYDGLAVEENSFDRILFPRSIRGAEGPGNIDARRPTYTEFRWEWWYNVTERCIRTIKAKDPNHLCIVEPMGGSDKGPEDVGWTPQLRIPEGTDGIDIHSYPSLYSTQGFEKDTVEGLKGETNVAVAKWAVITKSLSIPLIIGEAGQSTPTKDYAGKWAGNWTGEICYDAWHAGAKGILLYTWCREGAPAYGVNDQLTLIYDNMTFRDNFDWLPDFASVFVQETKYSLDVQVALIDQAFGVDWSVHGWLYCLSYLHINSHFISQKTLLDNGTEILDNYRLIVCAPDRLSNSAISLIMDWNKESPNHKVLWLGYPDRDEFMKSQSWTLWQGWMLNKPYDIDWGWAGGGRRNVTLRVVNRAFGNLAEGVELNFTTPCYFLNITSSQIDELVGCELRILWGNDENKVALWTINDTAGWFFADTYVRGQWGPAFSDDYSIQPQPATLAILNATLAWAGLNLSYNSTP